jgi:hypothetical protein
MEARDEFGAGRRQAEPGDKMLNLPAVFGS